MFYSLTGTYVASEPGMAVVSCGGVAFKCLTTMHTLRTMGQIGQQTTLYTHLNVREDALDLFGFAEKEELDCFRKILAVSGVGPKMALAILSDLTPAQLAMTVAAGDARALTRVSGVGAKTAQRIILELKDKLAASPVAAVGNAAAPVDVSMVEDAVQALTALGFTKTEAASAAGRCAGCESVEQIITAALKLLSK